MGEIKQTNFRIDQDTADIFRKICEEKGINQAQGFDHIIQVYELNTAKQAVPGRLVEIEAFEQNLKSILDAYLNSIELGATTEERVKEQFRSDLKRSETIISDLQKQRDAMEQSALESSRDAKEAQKKSSQLLQQNEQLKKTLIDQEKQLMRRDQINDQLSAQISSLKKEAEARALLPEKYEQLQEKYRLLESEHRNYQHRMELQLAMLQKEAETVQTVITTQKEQIRTLEESLSLEKQQQLQTLQKLEQQKAEAAIDKTASLSALKEQMTEQLRMAENEIIRLQTKLELLTPGK